MSEIFSKTTNKVQWLRRKLQLQMGRHTQNQIFFKFSTATAIHTMCDYICYIKTRASNSKRPWCLRTAPLSGFLKNRGRSRGSDLGEERSKASCPLWSPAAWAKRNLNHSVRVITTTREPPPHNTWTNGRCDSHQLSEGWSLTCFILFRELVMRSVMLWYVRMAVVSSV